MVCLPVGSRDTALPASLVTGFHVDLAFTSRVMSVWVIETCTHLRRSSHVPELSQVFQEIV